MCTVAIIIINYNGTQDTLECLSSLNKWLLGAKDIHFEVVLLDNHSSGAFPIEQIPQDGVSIHFYQSDENLGFAGGNNLAMRLISKDICSIDYYFLLNNDTILVDDSLPRLVLATNQSKYGVTGIVNYYYSHPEDCWQAGSFIRANRLSGAEVNPWEKPDGKFVDVDSVPGSSLLIKKEVTDKIGLLDERFFAYYEELDWCLRAKEAGYQVAFLTGTKLLHKVGRSSTSVFKHYLRTRNTLLLYSVHFKRWLPVARLRVLLRTAKESAKFGNRGLWKAYFEGIKDYKSGTFGKGTLKI